MVESQRNQAAQAPSQSEAVSEPAGPTTIFKGSTHPMICLSHVIFKSLALAFYLFFGIFSSNKVLCYIFVIIFNAVDFWTVKNVTGRILVGLRWWAYIKDDGKEEWVYESVSHRKFILYLFVFRRTQ